MFSFEKRNEQLAVRELLNRVVNLSIPNSTPNDIDARSDQRYNRTLPVVLAIWEGDRVVADEGLTALTKDLGDGGLAVVLRQPLRVERIVIGIWMGDRENKHGEGGPCFILGSIRKSSQIGGGFWQIGIHAEKLLSPADCPELEKLEPLVANLAPKPTHPVELPTAASVQ